MENFLLNFLGIYGPLGFGWVAAVFLAIQYKSQVKQTQHQMDENQKMLVRIVEDNTTAMVALKTYIEAKVE